MYIFIIVINFSMYAVTVNTNISLGNHEFDHGTTDLTNFLKNLRCPIVTSNIDAKHNSQLDIIKKSILIDIHGILIGVTGYITPETVDTTRWQINITEEIEALREQMKVLRNAGSTINIALGHSGYERDKEIAKHVEGLDLVIGGHTHTFLSDGSVPDSEDPVGPYPTYVTQPSGKTVAVVQAYAYTKYLGKLNIQLDGNGNILDIKGAPLLLDSTVREDPDILEIVHKYKTEFRSLADEVIGETSTLLDGQNCDIMECNLGNLITDAAVNYYATNYYRGDHWTDAPTALIQAAYIKASLRNDMTPSVISKGDLLSALPSSDSLVTIHVNGSILKQMLEHSISDATLGSPRSRKFLQMSGLRVTYNRLKPEGKRVVSSEVKCWFCDVPKYLPVEPDANYKIIVPLSLGEGGDGYHMLKDIPMVKLPFDILSCTEHYIAKHSPIYPGVEGRITMFIPGSSMLHN